MKLVEIKVKGLHCGGCSKRLTKVLSRLKGVMAVEVDLDQGIVAVQFDQTLTDASPFAPAIEGAGYDVLVA